MILAVVRPDSWNIPLFLHVAGAMVLVGAMVVVAWALVMAWRGDAAGFTRLAFRTLLYVAIPSFLVMRVGAQWIADKEKLEDADLAWVDIGFGVSDFGLLLLIAATITAGLGARKLGREPGGISGNARAAAVLTMIPLVLYIVAIWAMTTKPT
jgi:hypothetical protein